MTTAQHLKAEEYLFDLMCLGELTARLSDEARNGSRAELPATWLGLIGRLTCRLARDASDALGDVESA